MKPLIVVFAESGWDYSYIENSQEYSKQPFSCPGFIGANQAVACAKAGADVLMISILGKDEFGKKIFENFNQNGVNTNGIEFFGTTDFLTKNIDKQGNATLIVDKDGLGLERWYEKTLKHFSKQMVDKNLFAIKKAKLAITNAHLPKDVLKYFVEVCNKNNVEVIFTPCWKDKFDLNNKDDLDLLKKFKYITANEREVLNLTKSKTIEEAVEKLPNLIATAGERGVFYKTDKVNNLPAIKVEKVVDTTGAGDCFCGFFASALVNNLSFETALKKGIVASSFKVQKLGAQNTPNKVQVDEAFNKIFNSSREL